MPPPPIDSIDASSLFSSGASIAIRGSRPSAAAQSDFQARQRTRELGLFDSALRDLRRDLEALSRSSRVQSQRRVQTAQSAAPASASSTSGLGLVPQATYTTLRSIEEVNTIPTSFADIAPTVSGNTTAQPTIGGIYDGSQGDDVLTFEFRDDAIVGSGDKLRVRVRDSAGNNVGNLNFRNEPVGSAVTLSNGLTLTLGAGLVESGDTFELNVYASVGSAVDPTLPFSGTGNLTPGFDEGLGIVAGTFDVNGVSIAVVATDTIDDVMARITASAAGVDAVFDVATEGVLLTQRNPGSNAHIVLNNDTSGFLSATKLAGASEALGQDGSDPVFEPISSVPVLAGISTGQFSINGTSLSVDIDADSLGDVLDRINASAAGVTATLDPDTQRVTLTSNDPDANLVLADGSTGFFSTLKIAAKTYLPQLELEAVVENEQRFQNSPVLRKRLFDVGRSLNALFSATYGSASDEALDPVRGELIEAIRASLESQDLKADASTFNSRLGVVLDFGADGGKLLELDTQVLARHLANSAPALSELLFADEKDGTRGLVPSLLDQIGVLQARVASGLGRDPARGNLIDFRA